MSPDLYLSRLLLDLRSRRVQRELGDVYELHRTVMTGFANGCRRGGERVLYRVDALRGQPLAELLVQSVTEPDWGPLCSEGARGYLVEGRAENPGVKRFRPGFSEGQALVFRLRANSTVRRRGKRLGLCREEHQLAWLRRKGEAAGFALLAVRVSQEEALHGTLYRAGVQHRLELASVRFDGYLRVMDPERLAATVASGIGPGKGFGFGLLSLARA